MSFTKRGPSQQEIARASSVSARAYEISTYAPVSDWSRLIAETDDSIRDCVRLVLQATYKDRKLQEVLRARVDSGADVVIEFKKDGRAT